MFIYNPLNERMNKIMYNIMVSMGSPPRTKTWQKEELTSRK